jgi:phthalate 4,5-dioxygenase reductase subunit
MTTTAPPQTMKLRVARNDVIADGIYLLEFRDAGGEPLPPFSAGAHIAIRVPNGLLRKYSLCNDPVERERYQVAVKREVNGRGGSCSLIDDVKAGDELMVTAPVNDFGLPPRAQDFLFIAGGIGITPMMAMIRQVIAEGKRFRLFYCTRSPETTAFREELGAPEFKDMVTIHYDQGDVSRSLDLPPILAERKNREHLYCCGPRPLMEARYAP